MIRLKLPLCVASAQGCKRTGERNKGHSRIRTQTTCKYTRGLASQQIAAVERACFVRAPTRARARWTKRGGAFGAAALAPALFGHVCKKMAAEEHSVGVAGGVDLGHCVRTRKLQQSPPVSVPPAAPVTAEGLTQACREKPRRGVEIVFGDGVCIIPMRSPGSLAAVAWVRSTVA